MSGLRIGELFAGYGGLGMGVKAVLGGEVAWVSDIDKGACKVLAHRFPDVLNLGDITTVDWSQVEPVDVLCGGFPCQDVSSAGKRAGLKSGTRSGLWHEMARAIAALRPRLVVIENVRGLLTARGDTSEAYEAAVLRVGLSTTLREWIDQRRYRALREGRIDDAQRLATRAHRIMGLHNRAVEAVRWAERRIIRAIGTVLGTLADLGYDASWHGLRAADAGAPHGRFRIFICAYPADTARNGWHQRRPQSTGVLGRPDAPFGGLLPTPRTSDTNGAGPHGEGGVDLRTAVALLPTPACNDMGEGKTPDAWDEWTAKMQAAHGNGNGHGKSLAIEAQRLLPTQKATNNENRQSEGYGGRNGNYHGLLTGESQWGQYAAAIAQWETILGRPAPEPAEPGRTGNPRLSPKFTEWVMGLPAGWVTDVPGVTRNEALKLCGNGVVPQQAAAALRIMLDWIEATA